MLLCIGQECEERGGQHRLSYVCLRTDVDLKATIPLYHGSDKAQCSKLLVQLSSGTREAAIRQFDASVSKKMGTPEGRVPFVHHGGNGLLDHQVALFPAALALHPTAPA